MRYPTRSRFRLRIEPCSEIPLGAIGEQSAAPHQRPDSGLGIFARGGLQGSGLEVPSGKREGAERDRKLAAIKANTSSSESTTVGFTTGFAAEAPLQPDPRKHRAKSHWITKKPTLPPLKISLIKANKSLRISKAAERMRKIGRHQSQISQRRQEGITDFDSEG